MNRRDYFAAASAYPASFSREESSTGIMEKTEMRVTMKEVSESAWTLDSIQGYYRPENCAVEIDPAKLREMLWNPTRG